MSFGISISDVSMLTKLAWKTIQNTRRAGSHYEAVASEVTSLHRVLCRLEQELSTPESTLHGPRNSNKEEITDIMLQCRTSLGLLDKLLERYDSLSSGERTAKTILQRFRFGNGELAGIEQLKSNIKAHTDNLNLCVNIMSTGAVGRVEKQMNDAGNDLNEVKRAVNGIATRLAKEASTKGSVLTAYTNDDPQFWKEFRRRLVRKGFKSRFLQEHENLIHAYIEELGDRGVLDDPDCVTVVPEDNDLAHTHSSAEPSDLPPSASGYKRSPLKRCQTGQSKLYDIFSGWLSSALMSNRLVAMERGPLRLALRRHVSRKTAEKPPGAESDECLHRPRAASWMTMSSHPSGLSRWGKSRKNSSPSTIRPRSLNGDEAHLDAVFYAFPATDSYVQDAPVFTTGVGTIAQIQDFENLRYSKNSEARVQSWHEWRREVAWSTGYEYSQRQLRPERSFLAAAWGTCLIMEDLDVSTLLADFEYLNLALHCAHCQMHDIVDEKRTSGCDWRMEDPIYDYLIEETEDILRVLAAPLWCTENVYWEPITKSIVSRNDLNLNSNMIGAAAVSFIAKSLKLEMSVSAHQDTDVILKGILHWIEVFNGWNSSRDAFPVQTYFLEDSVVYKMRG